MPVSTRCQANFIGDCVESPKKKQARDPVIERVEKEGCILLQKGYSNSANFDAKWRSIFGVSARVAAKAWRLLHVDDNMDNSVTHLLWALYFLKTYPTGNMAEVFAKVDRGTFTSKAWNFIDHLSYLEADVVSFFVFL